MTTTAELQYHQSPAPSARCRDRDGNYAIGVFRDGQERKPSNENSNPSNGDYSASNNWLERSVGESRDALMTSSVNQQREIMLLDDENDLRANDRATSPDVIVSASTYTAT